MAQVAGPLGILSVGDVQTTGPPSPARSHRRRSSKGGNETKIPGFLSLFRGKDKKLEKKADKDRRPSEIGAMIILHEHRQPQTARHVAPPRAPEPPNAAETGLPAPTRRSTEFTTRPPRHERGIPAVQPEEHFAYHWDPHLPLPRFEERVPPSRRQSQLQNNSAKPIERPDILRNTTTQPILDDLEVPKSHVGNSGQTRPDIRVTGNDLEPHPREYPPEVVDDQNQPGEDVLDHARMRRELDEVKEQLRQAQGQIAKTSALQAAATIAAEVRAAEAARDGQSHNKIRGQPGIVGQDMAGNHDARKGHHPVKPQLTAHEEMMENRIGTRHPERRRSHAGRHREGAHVGDRDPSQPQSPRRSTSNREPQRPRLHQSHRATTSDPRANRERLHAQQYVVIAGRAREEQRDSPPFPEGVKSSRRRSHHNKAIVNTAINVGASSTSAQEPEAPNARFDPHSSELTAYDRLYFESRRQSQELQDQPPPQPTLHNPAESSARHSPPADQAGFPQPTPYARRHRRHHHHSSRNEQHRQSYPSRNYRLSNTPSPDSLHREQRRQYWYGSGPTTTAVTNTSTGRSTDVHPTASRAVRRSQHGSEDLRGEYGTARRPNGESSRHSPDKDSKAPGAGKRSLGGDRSAGPERPKSWWI